MQERCKVVSRVSRAMIGCQRAVDVSDTQHHYEGFETASPCEVELLPLILRTYRDSRGAAEGDGSQRPA